MTLVSLLLFSLQYRCVDVSVMYQIVLYQMNGGKGCMVRDKPPDLPEQGADAIYR